MTKPVNRKYLICVENKGTVYTHMFSKKRAYGGTYYHTENRFAYTEEEMRNSIVIGYNHAIDLRNELVYQYKEKLPKGERLKVFIRRIYNKDMGMLK